MSEAIVYRVPVNHMQPAELRPSETGYDVVMIEHYQALRDEVARLTKVLVQYKNLWALRGEALKRPCLSCGYVQKQIVPMEGSGNE